MGGALETTPLMAGPGPPLAHLHRRLSALAPTALRRNSMRGTEHLVPAMGKLGSFLFLSNLITGARAAWARLRRARMCNIAQPDRGDGEALLGLRGCAASACVAAAVGGRCAAHRARWAHCVHSEHGAAAVCSCADGAARSTTRALPLLTTHVRALALRLRGVAHAPRAAPRHAGPGMLAFPAAYQARCVDATRRHCTAGCPAHAYRPDACCLTTQQEGGWLPGVFFTLLFMWLTVLTSSYLVKVVQHFKARARAQAQTQCSALSISLRLCAHAARTRSERSSGQHTTHARLLRRGATRRSALASTAPPLSLLSSHAPACAHQPALPPVARSQHANLDRGMSLMSDGDKHHGHGPRVMFIEYETLVRATGSRAAWLVFQCVFISSMCMMAISCICVVARALDNLSISTFGNAYGLQILPEFGFRPSCRAGEDCRSRQAFQDTSDVHGYVITQGYMLAMAITVPFSLIDINDWFQGTAYVLSLLCLVEMICVFSYIAWAPSMAADRALYGGGGTIPMASYNVGLIIEVCFWSWAIGFAIPMWLDEKADDVRASTPLWAACLHRGVLDVLLGLSGAAAFPGLATLNVLDELRVRPDVGTLTELCGIGFAITALIPNIVDYQMSVARNMESHLGAERANWLGVGTSWSIGWCFYFGNAFNILVNVTSVGLNGIIELLVPALLFLYFSRNFSMATFRMGGLHLDVPTWRRITLGVAILIATLIAAAYTLNACVRLGVWGPLHKLKHTSSAEEDYSHYAAYDDLTAPPGPPGAIAPAAAPAGAVPGVVR
jgi:hypothetical protein